MSVELTALFSHDQAHQALNIAIRLTAALPTGAGAPIAGAAAGTAPLRRGGMASDPLHADSFCAPSESQSSIEFHR